jgi:hypothetical protein
MLYDIEQQLRLERLTCKLRTYGITNAERITAAVNKRAEIHAYRSCYSYTSWFDLYASQVLECASTGCILPWWIDFYTTTGE